MSTKHHRHVFTGELGADRALRIRAGAHVRVTDREGAIISDSYEPRRRLLANIGDALIVASMDLDSDAIAYVQVFEVNQNGNPHVQVLHGSLAIGAVHVMAVRKAVPPKRRTRAREPVAMPGASLAAMVRRARLELGAAP